MTTPPSPWGTFSEVSRTSRAFSLKIARISFSSAVSSVSPFGVTLPTSRSPEPTSAPMRTMPRSSRLRSDSSERFGMSRVISSSPSFVVRASISYSSMWIEVSSSSLTRRLREDDRVLEVVALPGHEGDHQVLAQRHLAVVGRGAVGQHLAGLHLSGRVSTSGFWWMSVPWLERLNFCSSYSCACRRLPSIDDLLGVDVGDRRRPRGPGATSPVSSAARRSMPVPTTRGVGLQQRHGLALHVRAHQRAVGVVVLEERDHRRGDRPDLLGRDVHEVDVARARPSRTGRPACGRRPRRPDELAVLSSSGRVGLRDQLLLLLRGVQVDDLVGDLAVLDDAVGRRDEAVLGDLARSSTASRSGRCSGPPASRSGTCGRSASGGRRGPRSARARGSGRRRRAPTGGGGASGRPASSSGP